MNLGIKLPTLKLSPVMRISMGLISLIVGWIFLLDMLLGFWPDMGKTTLELRRKTSENLAIQSTIYIQAKNVAGLEKLFELALNKNQELRSVAIRHKSGRLVLQAGGHEKNWPLDLKKGTIDYIQVGIKANQEDWGTLELAFKPYAPTTLLEWFKQPVILSFILLVFGGLTIYWLFLRGLFTTLNPSSVVPDRVKSTFDAFSTGVVMVDNTGKIMIANKTFRKWGNDQDTELFGKPTSDIKWINEALGADQKIYPWARAMETMQGINGWDMKIKPVEGEPIKVLVNCSLVQDAVGTVRGCLVTFDDVTELDKKNEELRKTMTQLEKSQAEIQQKNEELYRLATRDPMTGAYNRRAFYAEAEKIFQEYKANKKPLCALMTDIDHFKKFNDVHGHAIGDKVIVAFSKSLGVGLRTEDKLCRYGGEEFVILLPGAEPKVAHNIAERLRVEVEQRAGPSIRHTVPLNITSSFGVGVLEDDVVDLAMLVDRADQGLYVAKKSGRNRVKFYGEPIEENAPPEAPRDLF